MARRRPSHKNVAEAFGRALVRTRLEVEMTQEELADAAGLHRTTIGLFERGLKCPALDTIIRLARAMDVPSSELVNLAEVELS